MSGFVVWRKACPEAWSSNSSLSCQGVPLDLLSSPRQLSSAAALNSYLTERLEDLDYSLAYERVAKTASLRRGLIQNELVRYCRSISVPHGILT